jgi:hypothetical protein
VSTFIVVERPNMVLGLNYGVYRAGEGKAVCYCYSMVGATSIADALTASEHASQAETMPMVESKPDATAMRRALPKAKRGASSKVSSKAASGRKGSKKK